MDQKRKLFTKAFEEEAVRLVRTSGRTKREIAADLSVGLSTLTRWLARSRERVMDAPSGRRLERIRPPSSSGCGGRTKSCARSATS